MAQWLEDWGFTDMACAAYLEVMDSKLVGLNLGCVVICLSGTSTKNVLHTRVSLPRKVVLYCKQNCAVEVMMYVVILARMQDRIPRNADMTVLLVIRQGF